MKKNRKKRKTIKVIPHEHYDLLTMWMFFFSVCLLHCHHIEFETTVYFFVMKLIMHLFCNKMLLIIGCFYLKSLMIQFSRLSTNAGKDLKKNQPKNNSCML